jgi:hypothetical protein
MNNGSLARMARKAGREASLMASLIRRYAQAKGLRWEDIAPHLQIDAVQLARLALCRKPEKGQREEGISTIATYVGMDSKRLAAFIESVEKPQRAAKRQSVQGRSRPGVVEGRQSMSRAWTWGIGLAVIMLLFVGAAVLAQPSGPEATLLVWNGQATVTQSRTVLWAIPTHSESVVPTGQTVTVAAGDRIAVHSDSAAQLRLLDGSTVDLFSNTVVEIGELQTTPETFQFRLDMLAGRVLSRVVSLLDVEDRFEISTPSATASVRGTVFTVQVIDEETTFVACEEGFVVVTMGGEEVEVRAGEEVTAQMGLPLEVTPTVREETSGEGETTGDEDTAGTGAVQTGTDTSPSTGTVQTDTSTGDVSGTAAEPAYSDASEQGGGGSEPDRDVPPTEAPPPADDELPPGLQGNPAHDGNLPPGHGGSSPGQNP